MSKTPTNNTQRTRQAAGGTLDGNRHFVMWGHGPRRRMELLPTDELEPLSAPTITDQAEKAKQLDTALRGIREVRGCLQLLGQVSGELKSSLHVTGNLTVALKGLNEAQIKEALRDAGAGNWHRIEDLPREQREKRIWELLCKAGGREAFRPAGDDSKPN